MTAQQAREWAARQWRELRRRLNLRARIDDSRPLVTVNEARRRLSQSESSFPQRDPEAWHKRRAREERILIGRLIGGRSRVARYEAWEALVQYHFDALDELLSDTTTERFR